MMENDIIILIYKRDNDNCNKNYSTVVGEKDFFNRVATQRIGLSEDLVKKILELQHGKHEIDGNIIYIVPSNQFNLSTAQYPLIIIKNDEVIDIDEWWYSPFKEILFHSYIGHPLIDIDTKKYVNHSDIEDSLTCGYIVKCVNQMDSDDVIYALRTNNVTFNQN